jgi:VWFA-related protein
MRRFLCVIVASMSMVGASRAQEPAAQERFADRVDVARILIDARVVDDAGRPVPDLVPVDFDLKIDGKPARVESVEWVEGETLEVPLAFPAGGPSKAEGGLAAAAPRGRLIVFLVQKSLEPVRAVGLLQWLQNSERLFAALTPDDRVAVLSFDYHLRTWLDFTGDLDRVRTVMVRDVLFKSPPPVEPGPEPSLLARLSQAEGRKTYGIEEALQRLAHALAPLPGSKSVVLVGYGFGRLNLRDGRAFLMDGYEEARIALQDARATLLCLDITAADYHTLEHGLRTVAADTGGIFARFSSNPHQAIDRIAGALAGHYVLFAEKPEASPGVHRIDVRLVGRKGTVHARSSYTE